MKKTRYRIFRLEENKKSKNVKKITMKKFYASNAKDAYERLKEYKTIANKKYTYFYEKFEPIHIIDSESGKVKKYDSIEEYRKNKIAKLPWYKKTFEAITDFIWEVFIDKPNNFKDFIRDIVYFIKNKQYYRASWNLDYYLLNTIVHNLYKLIETKYGISQKFVDMARLKLHESEKDFNLEEYNKTNYNITAAEEELAVKYQKETFLKIIETIILYKYYMNNGELEPEDLRYIDKTQFEAKYKQTLPLIPGTYKEYDIKKMDALITKTWNKIWEYVRQYGQSFWD